MLVNMIFELSMGLEFLLNTVILLSWSCDYPRKVSSTTDYGQSL